MTSFLSEHLVHFSKSVEAHSESNNSGGKNAKKFVGGIFGLGSDVLPDRKLCRCEVFERVARPSVSDLTVCAAIMAWGGMWYKHRNMLFNTASRQEWLGIAQSIRRGEIDRKTAYGRLRELRLQKKLRGAGPAYFTKLIYFLLPRDDSAPKAGYIMDQWAGCSINLLSGREVVLMDTNKIRKQIIGPTAPSYAFRVSDRNTEANYEAFCCAVDRLEEYFGINTDRIDRALVSDGGKTPTPWRQYVMKHRLQRILDDLDDRD
ncbi:MAG: hypothetical protein F4114_13400 [Rhodospirillaceae bacterium]|nr:hypothetical protein [Rhodospirillaceae bacterium]MYI50064.1 hypothetical protein [Rhodospirillaceae bacterium]